MDKNLEIQELLRRKIKEVGKKSSARKNALKNLERAYLLQSVELERIKSLYNSTLKDYSQLQIDYKKLYTDNTELNYQYTCAMEALKDANSLVEKLIKNHINNPPKWKFWL
jgi:hypothetical protein